MANRADALRRELAIFNTWWHETLELQGVAQLVKTPLYHYTGASGLQGIIENQEIWFTSMFHLNDPTELKYGWEIAQEFLREHGDLGDEHRKTLCEDFTNGFNGMVKIFGYFVASFSRNEDDLGQWRAYGDNGRGFAIGLAPRLFNPIPPTDGQQPHEKAYVAEVIYGRSNAKALFSDAIIRVMKIARAVSIKDFEDQAKTIEFIADCWSALTLPICWYALQTKHEAYSQEQETRLMIQASRADLREHIKIRSRNSSLVPYIKYPLPVREIGNIVEIVIGPAADQRAEDAVQTLVFATGLSEEIKIRRSSIPYTI